MEINDLISAVSILITFILGIASTFISIRNSKKLKDMETYKHTLKMKELRVDTQYKNNQLVIEEVHMLLTNIKNLSCTSDCYLFRNDSEKRQKYKEAIIESRESLIWVRKRVNILSAYMDKTIYSNIEQLLLLAREVLEKIENTEFDDFLNGFLLDNIQIIEEKGLKIIKMIQEDNENIIEN